MQKNYILLLLTLFAFSANSQSFQLVKDVNPSNNGMMLDCSFRELNGKLYYVFYDETILKNALYTSDGTANGTYRISPETVNVWGNLTIGGNKIYFFAGDSTNGKEPWVSDGTAAGTMMLMNISPTTTEITFETTGSQFLSADANKAFFLANNGITGNELWVTDGTTAGTQLVKDIYIGSQGTTITVPQAMGTNMKDGKLYFFAINGNDGFTVSGVEPWVSDGTEAGTFMLKDIRVGYEGSSGSANTKHFIEYNGKMYFFALTSTFFGGLYETDGTTAGTQMVFETPMYRIDEFKVWNNLLYFTHTNGPALSFTDGTSAGTMLVATIPNGQLNNVATCQMVDLGGTIYLRGVSNTVGSELFKLTGNQIVNIKDIAPGTASGVSGNVYPDKRILQIYDDKIWFLGSDGTQNGTPQIWNSDGTADGTVALSPLNNDGGYAGGTGNYYNIFATSFGMFMIYNNPITGSELYRYDANSLGTETVTTNNNFMVYPNPADGEINIKINDGLIGAEITLFDIAGRKIQQREVFENLTTLSLQPGIYLISLEKNGKRQTKKIVIH